MHFKHLFFAEKEKIIFVLLSFALFFLSATSFAGSSFESLIFGSDSNNNEIRDDIEIWIGSNVKNINLKKAFLQYSQSFHRTTKVPLFDREEYVKKKLFLENARTCISFLGSKDNYDTVESFEILLPLLQNELVNTFVRKIYYRFSELKSSEFDMPSKVPTLREQIQSCQFRISNFESFISDFKTLSLREKQGLIELNNQKK